MVNGFWFDGYPEIFCFKADGVFEFGPEDETWIRWFQVQMKWVVGIGEWIDKNYWQEKKSIGRVQDELP